ncbi:MAG: FMN-binding protein [Clostridiales bacterium]|nr:FMN-binding protein [Clostridiales bacterium]
MKKPIKVLMIIASIIVLFIVAGAIFFSVTTGKLESLSDVTVQDVDLSDIADGTYTGSHDVFPVSVTVEVTVIDHAITEIDLIKHTNGQGQDAETIPHEVIEKQSLQVDAVSGATYSSKVILLAIQDALESAE